jgi:signal transduction histidine kinase
LSKLMIRDHNGDASPVQKNLSEDRMTGAIPLTPRPEGWQTGILGIGWLSTSIVHDLRNPLGTVLAGSEMLMGLDPASTQVRRLASNIHHAAGRMRELLTDLAGATCGSKSPSETCEIRDVVAAASEAVLPTAEKQRVQILNNVPGGLEISLMRSRMERVFLNLITNALEAMPHGGEIRIGLRRAANCVLIEIEDTGPGIPRTIRDRLFEPFVTAGKDDGLGLGLALSRQTVLDHGGDMWTEPASGARFIIRIPLKRDERLRRSCTRRRRTEGRH